MLRAALPRAGVLLRSTRVRIANHVRPGTSLAAARKKAKTGRVDARRSDRCRRTRVCREYAGNLPSPERVSHWTMAMVEYRNRVHVIDGQHLPAVAGIPAVFALVPVV